MASDSTFFPLPGTYAVVELDVERTLQALDDPIANAAGASIKPTKCLIHLGIILQLPFPDDKTFKYMVNLIGPGLRPEVPELCCISDMCVPIFPNTYHPSGAREALRTSPEFPFKNCYHWFGSDMEMDLRIWNDGRDYRKAEQTELPGVYWADMELFRGRDIWRAHCAREARDKPVAAAADNLKPAEADSEPACGDLEQAALQQDAESIGSSKPRDQQPHGENGTHLTVDESREDAEWPPSECDTESSKSVMYQASEGSNASAHTLQGMDIFGFGDNERDDLLPIVKIWMDIGAHFKEEDVPNPVDFIRQRDELVRIIEESKARARARNRDAESAGEGWREHSDDAEPPKLSKGFWYKLLRASGAVICIG